MDNVSLMTPEQTERYSRQIIVPEIGGHGQQRLLAVRVLLVGAGALGGATALYLVGMGIGCLTVVDGKRVEGPSVARQPLHTRGTIGLPRAISAFQTLRALNPTIRIEPVATWITPENVAALVQSHDVILDGTNNPTTRLLLHRTALTLGRSFVALWTAGIWGWMVPIWSRPDPNAPCLACDPDVLAVPPVPPASDRSSPTDEKDAATAHLLAPLLPGVLGTMAASEIVQGVLGLAGGGAGWTRFHLLDSRFDRLTVGKKKDCPVCGTLTQEAGAQSFVLCGTDAADAETRTVDAEIDITTDVCPMTFVKVRIKMDTLAPGATLRIRLNNGEPLENVPRTLRDRGCTVSTPIPDGNAYWLVARKPD
jgi:adenylyltransferase/sulfurtransferase